MMSLTLPPIIHESWTQSTHFPPNQTRIISVSYAWSSWSPLNDIQYLQLKTAHIITRGTPEWYDSRLFLCRHWTFLTPSDCSTTLWCLHH
jgi:hypothetical protein